VGTEILRSPSGAWVRASCGGAGRRYPPPGSAEEILDVLARARAVRDTAEEAERIREKWAAQQAAKPSAAPGVGAGPLTDRSEASGSSTAPGAQVGSKARLERPPPPAAPRPKLGLFIGEGA
jgi:hypothetical protein